MNRRCYVFWVFVGLLSAADCLSAASGSVQIQHQESRRSTGIRAQVSGGSLVVDPGFGVRPPCKPGHRPIIIVEPPSRRYLPYVPKYERDRERERQQQAKKQPLPVNPVFITPPRPRVFKKCEEGPDAMDPNCMHKPKSARQLQWEQYMRRNNL